MYLPEKTASGGFQSSTKLNSFPCNPTHLSIMVRGSGKYKVKRGGGRQFTDVREMTLNKNRVAVSKRSAYRFDQKRLTPHTGRS